MLGTSLEPARLDDWVREFTGFCEEPGPTHFDKRVAAVLQLKLPAVMVAAVVGYGATAVGLVYLDVEEPWFGRLMPFCGLVALCALLALFAAIGSLIRRIRPPACRKPN